MNQAVEQFEDHIIASVVKEIQELIKLDYVTDAIEKLFDFIRDFAGHSPVNKELLRGALQLSARQARFQKARRHRLPEPEAAERIVHDLIRQVENAAKVAKLPSAQPRFDIQEELAATIDSKMRDAEFSGFSPDDLKKLLIRASQKQRRPSKSLVANVEAVTHAWGRGEFKLGPLSFPLRDGEITGVVGMNASGKTTLLKLLLGDLMPKGGKVTYPALQDEGLDWYAIKGTLGYVAQLPSPWPGRLRNNLNFTAAAYGLTGTANEELVEWYVHRYGLKAYENARWCEVSGGFKIRFELVRTLLTRPRLLILDEPLAYLDIVTQQLFLHDLRSIATSLEHPIPIIVTSQHLYEIEAIADRMVILDDGQCLYSGPAEELPESKEFVMFEVEVRADSKEILQTLRVLGLEDIEKTTNGWILIFKRRDNLKEIHEQLVTVFNGRLRYFRDITKSTRSLFRNHRDDFERSHGY